MFILYKKTSAMRLLPAFLIVFLCLSAGAQPVLDNFLSAPLASGLAASKDGKQLAWIVNDRGGTSFCAMRQGRPDKLLHTFRMMARSFHS
jgi:hypothetical protein